MSNEYKKKARKKSLLGELSPAEKKAQFEKIANHPGSSTIVDMISAIGGGFAGTAIGRPSFFSGAIISGVSHFFKKHIGETWSRIGSVFGVGVMAGGITKGSESVSGLGSSMEAAKARMKNYREDLKSRLYLDTFLSKKKDQTATTEEKKTTGASSEKTEEDKTVGETQTFIYPETEPRKSDIDLSSLDEIEAGLHRSAAQFEQNRGTDGLGKGVNGTDDIDPEDKNY